MSVMSQLVNQVYVQGVSHQGSFRSFTLQEIEEELFSLAHRKNHQLQAFFLLGKDNGWADALSRHLTVAV